MLISHLSGIQVEAEDIQEILAGAVTDVGAVSAEFQFADFAVAFTRKCNVDKTYRLFSGAARGAGDSGGGDRPERRA